MRKESWNDPAAWIVSRSDSGALSLGLYPSAAGPICLPACSLNQHVILKKEIKNGIFCRWNLLSGYTGEEKIKTRSKGIIVRWFLIGGIVPPSQEN